MEPWRVKRIVNLLNGSTLLGLCRRDAGPGPDRRAARAGWCVATGYRLRCRRPSAFTIGNVVTSRHDRAWLDDAPALVRHEERHTWQYVVCLGLPMIPLYLLAAGWSLPRRRGPGGAQRVRAARRAGGRRLPDRRRAGPAASGLSGLSGASSANRASSPSTPAGPSTTTSESSASASCSSRARADQQRRAGPGRAGRGPPRTPRGPRGRRRRTARRRRGAPRARRRTARPLCMPGARTSSTSRPGSRPRPCRSRGVREGRLQTHERLRGVRQPARVHRDRQALLLDEGVLRRPRRPAGRGSSSRKA